MDNKDSLQVVADVIAGEDPSERAKENLKKARQDVADTIRETKSRKRKSEDIVKPTSKRKKVVYKTNTRKKSKKCYNIFVDSDNE